ncbi:hypothetical protein PCH_Pc22g17510 [Penicillium rubens Wisconsin 54-1255]|uniref:Uncharacterized protein n=1 Tax=Penicillium rubens (strain ATCC 28089 / DSM 1075 / NRRL 1951 / Wisconsin 54-1255) TaxID=500485 RepID=B6HSV6_PENRW|nr:hypothetical protein PCH_Pc22g17510 [Penicillium rubens Wisconsin 54-1255]
MTTYPWTLILFNKLGLTDYSPSFNGSPRLGPGFYERRFAERSATLESFLGKYDQLVRRSRVLHSAESDSVTVESSHPRASRRRMWDLFRFRGFRGKIGGKLLHTPYSMEFNYDRRFHVVGKQMVPFSKAGPRCWVDPIISTREIPFACGDSPSVAQMDTSPRASSLALVSMQFHHIVETGRAQEVWSTEYGVHVPIWAANSEKWNTGWL